VASWSSTAGRVAHPQSGKYRAGSRTAKIAMFDIKIECMRFARRSAAKGAGKAGWRHVNESAVTAASFYVRPNSGPLVEGGRSGTSVGFGTRQRC
jgi:hypothetical protein